MTSPPDRRAAVWTLGVGAVVFVAVAAWLVPWNPVPGGAVTPVDPSTLFTADQVERAEQFSRWARVWSWTSLAVSLAVACWFGFTAHGRRLVERLPGPWWVQVPLAVAALELLGRLVTLPFAVAQRRLRLDEGLSTQSWAGWAADLLKGQAITIGLTSVALVVAFVVVRRFRRAWPVVVGGLLAALVVAGSFVYPVVVEPVFSSFEPLPDGELRTAIYAVADEEGVEIGDVLVADASRRTTTINAYVSGFGSTRRVVVYDTLVDTLPEDQALSVVAHELAHARHGDVLVGTALGAAGALVGVGLLSLVVAGLRRRGHPALGEAAVVPLLLALVAIGTLASAPVQNGISRQIEARADVDALRTTQDPDAFVRMQRQLARSSLSDPTPPAWSQWWFGSHPTTTQRAAIAERLAE